MPWMPAPARRRKIAWLNALPRYGTKPTAIVLHITASEATSQHAYFARIRFAGSHFHVSRSGVIEQYAGTGARSAADRSSRRTISIETQGSWGPWTKDQIEAIAQVVAWCARTHGIPLRLMTSSKTSQHGVGWHRLGVDGNFPKGRYGGRLQRGGGEKWSGSAGKACPTGPCIDQIDDVVRRAKQINSGSGSPAVEKTETKDWFDMASEADLKKIVRAEIESVVRDVMMYEISVGGATKRAIGKSSSNTASLLRYAGAAVYEGRDQHAETTAQLAALRATVATIAAGQGLDVAKIEAAIDKAVSDALSGLSVTLTTEKEA